MTINSLLTSIILTDFAFDTTENFEEYLIKSLTSMFCVAILAVRFPLHLTARLSTVTVKELVSLRIGVTANTASSFHNKSFINGD